jgi:hypothetical protein
MAMPAAQKASKGATSAGMTTLSTSPSPCTASAPAATNAAPATPPMSACDELEGSPAYQVRRFQAMAPMRPAKTIVVVTAPASTMPLATVAATSSEMNAPTKLRTAAIATAARGESARVETVVAIALAVSWNPFVKSNASAVTTTMTRMMSPSTASAYAFLITTLSRTSATRSVASIAPSSRSKTSFQRITTIGSIPVSNSEATASRETRSPSFSSRWISTT